MSEETMKTNEENMETNDVERHIRVDVSRFDNIAEILSDKVKATRAALLVAMFTCAICIGVSVTALLIKRIYPYNNIETNIFGATTASSESKNVTYWLFNTAELWADSGIEVMPGDVLTIHASGKCFSAMHHLYDAAKANYMPADHWVGTEGEPGRPTMRDSLRAKWRIIPNRNTGTLLMKVALKGDDNDPIHVIGKESADLYISTRGRLQFAVNDIVLTQKNIFYMMYDDIQMVADDLVKKGKLNITDYKKVLKAFNDNRAKIDNNAVDDIERRNINLELFKTLEQYPEIGVGPYGFGSYYCENGDSVKTTVSAAWNELRYYSEKNYKNAWYDDNIGSFLIVVERKKSR